MDTFDLAGIPTTGPIPADLDPSPSAWRPLPPGEVTDSRRRFGAEHRAYARDLCSFMRDAGTRKVAEQVRAPLGWRKLSQRHVTVNTRPGAPRPWCQLPGTAVAGLLVSWSVWTTP